MEKDEDGRLPLHLSCADQAPVSVVSALLAAHPDGEAAGLRRDARVMGIAPALSGLAVPGAALPAPFAPLPKIRTKTAAATAPPPRKRTAATALPPPKRAAATAPPPAATCNLINISSDEDAAVPAPPAAAAKGQCDECHTALGKGHCPACHKHRDYPPPVGCKRQRTAKLDAGRCVFLCFC